MSNLEKHILENRDELDRIEEAPVLRMWNEVEKQLPHSAKAAKQRWLVWRIAAAVLLLVGVGVGSYFIGINDQPPAPNLAEIAPDFAAQEQQLQLEVAQRMDALDIEKLDRRLYREVLKELDELEKIHRETLKDLPVQGNDQRVIRTLLRYYEQKIRILELLSKEIENQKRHEERNHPTSI